MPSYDQNVEAPVTPMQQTTNPALLNEGYPGISSPQTQTSFQPPSDGSSVSATGSPAAALNGLSKDVLLGTITNLPQQDVATFFSGLPQNEQTQIQTFVQQNPNAQGQDLFNQLAQLPTADLVQGLVMVPGADLQQAIAAAQQGGSGVGTDTSNGTTYGAGGTDASMGQTGMQPAYNADGTQSPYQQTGDTSGLYTQPQAQTGDASGLYTQPQAQSGDGSGLNTQPPVGTDGSGLSTQAAAQQPQDATGGSQQPAGGDNSAVLNKLATLNATELGSVISRLPQQDLATFFQALPSSDQQALQSALANNDNPSPQDLAAAMSKLPTRDVLAAAGSVPASDFASLLPSDSGSQNAANQAPKPGGSEFPLLFGLGAAGTLGYVGYRRGLFNNVPDVFQQLTGRFNEHAPSWMTKFGRGGADAAEVESVVAPVAAAESPVASMAADGMSLGADLAKGSEALLKAGREVGTVAGALEHAGTAAVIAEDALDVAKVVH